MKMLARDVEWTTPHEDENELLVRYLSSAVVVTSAAGTAVDQRDASRGSVVPIGLVTDGHLVWPMAVRYYFENYGGALPIEVLTSARASGFTAPELSDANVAALREAVRDGLRTGSPGAYPDLRGDAAANPFG